MSETKRRLWTCPECGNVETRHHNEKNRPFCDDCEFREAVLIEMRPTGTDTDKFYDDKGHAINP